MSKSILGIIFVAFFLRLLLLITNTFWVTLPESGRDDKRFEYDAWVWSTQKYLPQDEFAESGAGIWIKCGALIYSVLGRVPFFWAFLVVILGTATVYNIYKATFLLWNDRTQSLRMAWFAAIFPELAMLSAVLLREVIIHFFLSLAIIYLIKFWKYKSKIALVFFFVYTGLCILFHSGMVVTLAGFGLAVLLISQEGKKKSTLYKVVAVLLVVAGLVLINYTGFGLSKFNGSFANALDKFQTQESKLALGRAAYPDWMKFTNGVTDIWKLPIRFLALLFAPAIPFMLKSASQAVGLIDAFIYIAIFYTYYKNRKAIKDNKSAYVIFIIAIALALSYCLGVSNFGTAIRHRAKLVPLLLVLAVDHKAIERNKLRLKKKQALRMAQAN